MLKSAESAGTIQEHFSRPRSGITIIAPGETWGNQIKSNYIHYIQLHLSTSKPYRFSKPIRFLRQTNNQQLTIRIRKVYPPHSSSCNFPQPRSGITIIAPGETWDNQIQSPRIILNYIQIRFKKTKIHYHPGSIV